MEETKALIQAFLEEQNSKTKFPFTSRVILFHKFGPLTDQALIALQSEGIVYPSPGVNGPLVRYIVEDIVREKVRKHFFKTP